MAKRRKKGRKGARRKKGGRKGGKTIGTHSFGGRKFSCYGKRVRAGKGRKKVARIFCGRMK